MTRKYLNAGIILIAISLSSCSGDKTQSCEYSNVIITASVDGKEVSKKEFTDCFIVEKEGEGELATYKVSGEKTSETLSLFYYDNPSAETKITNGTATNLTMLNVHLGDKSTDWRAKKGHDIILVEKTDTLGFIFGDNAKKENSVSASIVFTK